MLRHEVAVLQHWVTQPKPDYADRAVFAVLARLTGKGRRASSAEDEAGGLGSLPPWRQHGSG